MLSVVITHGQSFMKMYNLFCFYKALMELLDKVQLSYDTSDQDVKDITDGECNHIHLHKNR